MKTKTSSLLSCFGVSALIVLLAAGCTMDGGKVAEKDKNKIMVCKDTRDGETFSFSTNTITNMRAGIGAPSTFDVVTTDGKARTLSSDMGSWLKCEKFG